MIYIIIAVIIFVGCVGYWLGCKHTRKAIADSFDAEEHPLLWGKRIRAGVTRIK